MTLIIIGGKRIPEKLVNAFASEIKEGRRIYNSRREKRRINRVLIHACVAEELHKDILSSVGFTFWGKTEEAKEFDSKLGEYMESIGLGLYIIPRRK